MGVDQVGLRMEVLHELVVGLGVGDVAVYPDEDEQRVDHRSNLARGASRFKGVRSCPQP
jgi:hypothetical protein